MLTAIIQSRMGSQRFPRKAMAKICDVPMIFRVVDRVMLTPTITRMGQVVVASPDTPEDRMMLRKLKREFMNYDNFHVYAGEPENVLKRYYDCAKLYDATTIIRITGDCPIIDPQLIDDSLGFYGWGGYDYVTSRPGYPDGMDVEVFSSIVLEKAWENQRVDEHVTTYMLQEPSLNIGHMAMDVEAPGIKLSVDTKDDMRLMRLLIKKYGEFGMEDVYWIHDAETRKGGYLYKADDPTGDALREKVINDKE